MLRIFRHFCPEGSAIGALRAYRASDYASKLCIGQNEFSCTIKLILKFVTFNKVRTKIIF